MNKVAALETNHTLYTLYMEQQNSAIRDLIRRLGEDIGRLEAVVSDAYSKTYTSLTIDFKRHERREQPARRC